MFPVIAEHEIPVIQRGRREGLAAAEWGQLIRSMAASPNAPASRRRAPLRARTALRGVVTPVVRIGHRPIGISGERAAAQS